MAMTVCPRVVAMAALLLHSSVGAFSSPMSMSGSGHRKRPNKSAAHDMALKIGLDVVPVGHVTARAGILNAKNGVKKAKSGERDTNAPTVAWNADVEDFFWSERAHEGSKRHVISNGEAFPLVLLPDVLPAASLARAVSLLTSGTGSVLSGAEEMEQHELVGGRARALRRSLVSQLNPSGELLDTILSSLPPELVGSRDGSRRIHPYEDGSAVFYRSAEGDFYEEHHDSYSVGETPRERQRAYTVLFYLCVPPGPPSIGGTEFTRLTLADTKHTGYDCVERGKGGKGIIVKPRAGDVLVWPNFDREGRPYENSVHRALPLTPPLIPDKRISNKDGIGKVVINLWFEGVQQLQTRSTPSKNTSSEETAPAKDKKRKKRNRHIDMTRR